MSEHQLQIPYQSRDQTISDAIAANVDRALEGEDRRITFRLLFDSRFQTMGQLLDHVSALDTDGRRRLLNQARTGCGLPTVEQEKAQRAVEATNRSLAGSVRRDGQGRAFQICGEPGCGNFPVDPATGQHMPTDAKRWYCEEHRAGHEAEMEPWSMGLRYSPSGALEFSGDAETEARRLETEAKSRAVVREVREAERREEAEALAGLEAEALAQLRRELPEGIKI
jgi:hypothetical protein